MITTLTAPLPVRGAVPGLLCRGTPATFRGGLFSVSEATEHAENDRVWLACGGSTVEAVAADIALDWSSPLSVYATLHWLADRGHSLLWMLPTTHGGRCSTWRQSAILASVSVVRVVGGVEPVRALDRVFRMPTNTRASSARIADASVWWASCEADRDYFQLDQRVTADGLSPTHAGWRYTPCLGFTTYGTEVGQAAADCINAAALSDGCAILATDGSITVEIPDAA